MKKISIFICLLGALLLFFLMSASAIESESYFCVADMATGFSYDKKLKEWRTTNFKVDDKYILRKSKNKTCIWELQKIGSKYREVLCMNEFDKYGSLFCESPSIFRFNKNTLRYLKVITSGYWFYNEVIKEGSTTTSIEIGKCSPL